MALSSFLFQKKKTIAVAGWLPWLERCPDSPVLILGPGTRRKQLVNAEISATTNRRISLSHPPSLSKINQKFFLKIKFKN